MKLSPGSVVTIPDISWQELEQVLQELGENRATRITYSQGTLEIMVPLPEHEIPIDLLSDLVKILLKRSGRPYQPFGSTTFRQENLAGVEPDACFYIKNYQQMIGHRQLQPDDPPPDLVIEIDVTSKTRLDAYQAIAVPELWVYHQGQLTIYLLQEQGYETASTSPTFPQIPLLEIVPKVIARAWEVGSFQALAEFENSLA
ncbi:MAG: Uma2 family endonuclease, partial [Cyanobacteria bacterium P01_G01_bin.49]